jgi:hypothetical protein
MEYAIKSKPTIYNGTKFRSRLEARWGCFFDLLGWNWQYEPFDLHGWTPDFIVYGKNSRFIFVEIKPFVDQEILADYQDKISRGAKGHNCIILIDSFDTCPNFGGILAGYQFDTFNPESEYPGKPFEIHWKDAQQGVNSEYDIGSLFMAFDGVLWADQDNRKVFLTKESIEYKTFISKWTEAGEETRFHFG